MRRWTKSACVVLAWCIILPVLMGAGFTGRDRPDGSAQANIPIARSAQVIATRAAVTPTAATPMAGTVRVTTVSAVATWDVQPGDTLSAIAAALAVPGGWQALYAANRVRVGPNPNLIQPGTILVLPGLAKPVRYTVAAGDTLSGIATGLAVPGGWQALYAANRRVIGPDPGLIRPGTVLVAPGRAARPVRRHPASRRGGRGGRSGRGGRPRHVSSHPATPGPRPSVRPTILAGAMSRWLEYLVLAIGLLAVTALLADPLARFGRRLYRRRQATGQGRIILADHERLIVTYSVREDTVYVLTPPGEDPRAVLRAARLVLPDEKYEELAARLGVGPDWPLESGMD